MGNNMIMFGLNSVFPHLAIQGVFEHLWGHFFVLIFLFTAKCNVFNTVLTCD